MLSAYLSRASRMGSWRPSSRRLSDRATLADAILARIDRYFHGWAVFAHAMRVQLAKRHGAGHLPLWEMVFMARCARWIAAQQHRPDLNPYAAGVLGDLDQGRHTRS